MIASVPDWNDTACFISTAHMRVTSRYVTSSLTLGNQFTKDIACLCLNKNEFIAIFQFLYRGHGGHGQGI
jgi:hypothetical protein